MVAYNVHPDFIAPILSGRKTSTIRPDVRRRHARAGELVQLYVGMRTPECVRLLQAPCTRAVPIEIHATHVIAGGVRKVNPEYYRTLARIEGFSNFGNLQAWFERRYGLPALGFTQVCWDFSAATDLASAVELGVML